MRRASSASSGTIRVAIVAVSLALPAPFSFYPAIHGSYGASTFALAAALVLAALAPFVQRRGIVT